MGRKRAIREWSPALEQHNSGDALDKRDLDSETLT